jgi:hypothetical protein
VKESKEALIAELMALQGEEDKVTSRRIIECLDALGYVPQRLKVRGFVLSFHNNQVKQTIAKLGVREGNAFYSVKFYACKKPPEDFTNAVRETILKTKGRYRCCDCGICGASEGERGYRVAMPELGEFVQCGAYVVEIPGLNEDEAGDICSLLREQHAYYIGSTDKTLCVKTAASQE